MKKSFILVVILAAIVGAMLVMRTRANRTHRENVILNTTGHEGDAVATNGNTVVRLHGIANRDTNVTAQTGQVPQ